MDELLPYDNVDYSLWMDISSVFESLSCADRKKLRDLVMDFKKKNDKKDFGFEHEYMAAYFRREQKL